MEISQNIYAEFKGIQIWHKTTKLRLYTDDVACHLRNPLASVKALTQLIVEFGMILGYTINSDKSNLSGFNIITQLKEVVLKIVSGKWQKDGVKYLY